MPSCRDTYQAAARRAQAKVLASQRELEEELEVPMRHYVFPIPQARPACPVSPDSAAMSQLLEQLQCTNQLLVDLLGAVNSLTAAALCRREGNG